MNKIANYLISAIMLINALMMISISLSDRGRILNKIGGLELKAIIHYALLSIFTSGIIHTLIAIKNTKYNKNFTISIGVAILYLTTIPLNFIFSPFIYILITINSIFIWISYTISK